MHEVQVDVEQVRLTRRAATRWASQIFSASVRPIAPLLRPSGPSGQYRIRNKFRNGQPAPLRALPVASRIARRQYQDMNNSSGVGVLDKAVSVLGAMETGPASLAQLVSVTGLARPTAHRIAVALEHHRFVARDAQGRFVLGPRSPSWPRRPARTGWCRSPSRSSVICVT